jgi:YVTN family beta-propeller protein
MRLALALVLLCAFLSNCTTDPEEKPDITDSNRVWHICEGTFNWDNATIGYSDPGLEGYTAAVYEKVNGESLGDVLQSMYAHDDAYWLVVNNSSKIILVDKKTFEKKGEVVGLMSPRHVAFYQNKAFVTDLYADKVYVINTETLKIEAEITVDGWIEYALVYKEELWCFHQEKPSIYIYNASSFAPIDTIETAIRCGGIATTATTVAAIYDGTLGSKEDVQLFQIDLESRQILNSYASDQGSLKFLITTDAGYASIGTNGIQMFDGSLSPTNTIELNYEDVPYGFGRNNHTGDYYLSTAPSFTDKSRIYVFNQTGDQKAVYRAGVNCNGFFFE